MPIILYTTITISSCVFLLYTISMGAENLKGLQFMTDILDTLPFSKFHLILPFIHLYSCILLFKHDGSAYSVYY